MSKKKKIKEKEVEEPIEDIVDMDDEEDGTEIEENDTIDSSLEIGGQIHTQSDIVKNFKQLPKDVKYSKFGNVDVSTFFLKSKTYQLWQYVRKIQAMSKEELALIKENKKSIYTVTSASELKEHLDDNNKSYLWYSLMQLDDKEFEEKCDAMLQQLQNVNETGIIDSIYRDKELFSDALDQFNNTYNGDEKFIDDFGLMNSMMTLTEVSKARAGWAMTSMNTTINVTKNEDLTPQVEEEPEDSENKLKSFLKK